MSALTTGRLTADEALEACRTLGLSYRPDLRQPDGLWTARCPVCPLHADGMPLTIRESARGGTVSFSCKTGCPAEEVEAILAEAVSARIAAPHDGPMVEVGGDLVDALGFARKRLRLPELEGVMKHGEEEPLFSLVLMGGRRFTVGGTSELRNPTKVADVIADATDKYPPRITAKEMIDVANALRSIAVQDDTGASPKAVTRGWITSYLSESLGQVYDLSNPEDRRRAATGRSETFRTADDACLYLRAQDLERYLRTVLRVSSSAMSYPALCLRLRGLDFTRKAVTAPRDEHGHQAQRTYWMSPPGYDWEADQ